MSLLSIFPWDLIISLMTWILLWNTDDCGLHFGHRENRRLGKSILWVGFFVLVEMQFKVCPNMLGLVFIVPVFDGV